MIGGAKIYDREPFEKQKEFIDACYSSDYDYIQYGGAVRGGKSFALFLLLDSIFWEFRDRSPRYAIVRQNADQFRKQTLPKFYEVFPKSKLVQQPNAHNGWIAKFKGGQELIFFSENYDQNLKYLEDFKGLEVDGILFEEISGINQKTWEKAFERVGTWMMKERQEDIVNGLDIPPRIIASTCNPASNWLKKLIYDKWVNSTLPDRFKYIPSGVRDNPYVDEAWIENKRQVMSPINFRKFIEGDWEVNENEMPFFYDFKEEKHTRLISDEEYEKHIADGNQLWVSMDFNFDNACAVLGIKPHSGDRPIVIDCYSVFGGTRRLCEAIYADYGMPQFGYRITGDSTGSSGSAAGGVNPVTGQAHNNWDIVKEVFGLSDNDFDLKIQNANRLHELSRVLCNELYNWNIPIICKERCSDLIAETKKATPTEKGKLYKSRAHGHGMDLVDAKRYLYESWFPLHTKSIHDWLRFYRVNFLGEDPGHLPEPPDYIVEFPNYYQDKVFH